MSSRPRHVRAASVGQARPARPTPSQEDVPQTPWRKLSTGIALAFKGRRTKLGDRTNIPDATSVDVAQLYAELVKSPAHLRLMTKSQLQSVAVIVNEALPAGKRLDIWKWTKEELRNSLEDVFGFPRTETPKAPRRSSESMRFRHNYPPASPVTPMLLASPMILDSPTRKRHSTGGIPRPKTRLASNVSKSSADLFPAIPASISSTLRAARVAPDPPKTVGSKVPVLRNPKSKRKSESNSATTLVFANKPLRCDDMDICAKFDTIRSPPRPMRSSSPVTYESSSSSSPPSSPLASRSTHSSISRLATSTSFTTPIPSRSNSHNNIAASLSTSKMVSPSGSSSNIAAYGGGLTSAGGASGASAHVRSSHSGSVRGTSHPFLGPEHHQIMAEDLTVALLASRMADHPSSYTGSVTNSNSQNASIPSQSSYNTSAAPSLQPVSHMRTASTRSGGSGPRMSWMSTQGSRRLLDVVREEEDEDDDGDEEDEDGRPRKRRRAPEHTCQESQPNRFISHLNPQ